MAASLLAASSFFGQQSQNQGGCAQPQPVCKPAPKCAPLQEPMVPTNCAYNAPAEINIGMVGDIDFFASGSFIYWQASQDNMGIAAVNGQPFSDNVANSGTVNTTGLSQFSVVETSFSFKPGFKVGLGMNLQTDDWDGYMEYTRVHGSTTTSSNGTAVGQSVFATWGNPFYYAYSATASSLSYLMGSVYDSVTSSYTNHLDFFDVEMGRSYYVGKQLTFRPAWGARAAWILQNIHVGYAATGTVATTDDTGIYSHIPGYADVYSRNHSWAVGPRVGLTMNWLFDYGFRFFGSGYGDILYTKYKVQDKTVILGNIPASTQQGVSQKFTSLDHVQALRTHLDLEVGFGWGSYFDNNNWHVDLSAAYGYQVFFDQNMFRQYGTIVAPAFNSNPNGNLYVQGLTATMRLDF